MLRALLTRTRHRVLCRDEHGHRRGISILPRGAGQSVRLRTAVGDFCLSAPEVGQLRRIMADVIWERKPACAAACRDEFGYRCVISIASCPDGQGLRLRSVLGDLYVSPLKVGRLSRHLAEAITASTGRST